MVLDALQSGVAAALITVGVCGGLIIGVDVARASIGWVRQVIDGAVARWESEAAAEIEAEDAWEQFDREAEEERAMIEREGGV